LVTSKNPYFQSCSCMCMWSRCLEYQDTNHVTGLGLFHLKFQPPRSGWQSRVDCQPPRRQSSFKLRGPLRSEPPGLAPVATSPSPRRIPPRRIPPLGRLRPGSRGLHARAEASDRRCSLGPGGPVRCGPTPRGTGGTRCRVLGGRGGPRRRAPCGGFLERGGALWGPATVRRVQSVGRFIAVVVGVGLPRQSGPDGERATSRAVAVGMARGPGRRRLPWVPASLVRFGEGGPPCHRLGGDPGWFGHGSPTRDTAVRPGSSAPASMLTYLAGARRWLSAVRRATDGARLWLS
jgi:hypothetical protein